MSNTKPSAFQISSVVEYLLQNNFHEAANALQNEFITPTEYNTSISASQSAAECSNLIQLYESSLDDTKAELFNCLFPIFVHVYLLFVAENDISGAHSFYRSNANIFRDNSLYSQIIGELVDVEPYNFTENKIVKIFRRVKFNVSMSSPVLQIFKRFLSLNPSLKTLIQLFFTLHSYPSLTNHFIGQFSNQVNFPQRLFFGLLTDSAVDDDRKKMVGRSKNTQDLFQSPNLSRVPLPHKMVNRLNMRKPSKKRLVIGSDTPPSIYIYSLLNFKYNVTSTCISDDSALMSATFADNRLAIYGMTSSSLLRIKSVHDLEQIDFENVGDISELLCDERSTASNLRILYGHSGPVYGSSFNPIGDKIVSCSQDSTIRLWSLMTYSTLAIFKDFGGPIWDVKFGPYGHYFLTGGKDCVAKLWSCDSPVPLRLFTGHLADLTCLAHHPNGNYVATGSHDGMTRIFDIYDGRCVLLFTGHKETVSCLVFSNDGRFLLSGGVDGCIMVWSLATGELAVRLLCDGENITTMTFSREGEILACGTNKSKIFIWDFRSILRHLARMENESVFLTFDCNESEYMLSKYLTKDSILCTLHFTNRNLLLGVDVFNSESDE